MNLQEQWPDWRDEINDALLDCYRSNTSMVSVQHRALLQSQIVMLKGLAVQLGGRVTEKDGIPFIWTYSEVLYTIRDDEPKETDKPRIIVDPRRLLDGSKCWHVVGAEYNQVLMQEGPEIGLIMDESELAVWEQRGWTIEGAER